MDASNFTNWDIDDILRQIDSLCDFHTPSERMKMQTDYSDYTPEKLEKKGFSETQIDEIVAGVSRKLPVEYFAKTCYNWQQMSEIRNGLAEGLDVRMYDNPLFSAEQMREIHMGMLEGIDVTSYAKLVYSTKDMAAVRMNLLREAYRSNPGGHALTIEDEESGATIRISDDSMEAYVVLQEWHEYTDVQLRKILKKHDVTYGISKELLKTAIAAPRGTEQKVATGKHATKGKDGRYEFLFNAMLPGEPRICEDGSADYTAVVVADKKEAGDILARYYPAEAGKDGKTVTGVVVNGISGEQKPELRGQGITYDTQNHIYKASESGYVTYDEEANVLNVWNVYVVDGNINRYNGHISYNGAIYVKGSVGDLAEIKASGNVIVDGYVEAAHIIAGGNIILRGGMNGACMGLLEAGGRVIGKFFEKTTIYAKGDVEGNYFMSCNIITDRSVIAKGSKSRIVGGNIRAGYSIESCAVMSVGKESAVLDVGDPIWLGNRVKQTQDKLDKVEGELRQLYAGKERLSSVFGNGTSEQNALFHKTCVALDMKEEEKEKLLSEEKYNTHLSRRARAAYVRIHGRIEDNVTLIIGGKSKRTERCVRGAATISVGDIK